MPYKVHSYPSLDEKHNQHKDKFLLHSMTNLGVGEFGRPPGKRK